MCTRIRPYQRCAILAGLMSQQNVEIVRAMYEVANAGDKLDANFEVLAPDVEFHVSGAFPDLERVYRGHEGVRKLNEALNEPWIALSLEPERFIDTGSEVLVLSRFHARGRDGMETTRQLANLWTVRDGRIVRMEAFADQGSALAALGLSEQDVHARRLPRPGGGQFAT